MFIICAKYVHNKKNIAANFRKLRKRFKSRFGVFRKLRKQFKSVFQMFLLFFKISGKFSEIFGSVRKYSGISENIRNGSKVFSRCFINF